MLLKETKLTIFTVSIKISKTLSACLFDAVKACMYMAGHEKGV